MAGFTLIELLLVTAILGTLFALATAGVQSAQRSGAKTREINAGRQLITAYQLAAAENDGVFLPGYDRTVAELEWPDGTTVHGPVANRYPYRLAPYFGYSMEGIILVNRNATQIKSTDTYSVSCFPAFGINYLFLGGDMAANGGLTIPEEVLTRSSQSSNILAFASTASSGTNGDTTDGYSILTPPIIYGEMWVSSPWKRSAKPENYGHLHARHNGKVAAAFLDGSLRMLGIEELRDMRLWSKTAAEMDDPNYTIAKAPPSSGGRR